MGNAAILGHAMDQRVDGLELEFRPDPGDHRHIEGAAVKVAREIEQIDFEQHNAGVDTFGRRPKFSATPS